MVEAAVSLPQKPRGVATVGIPSLNGDEVGDCKFPADDPTVNNTRTKKMKWRRRAAHIYSEAIPKEVEGLRTTMAGTWDATTAESGTRGGLGGDGCEDQTERACYFDGREADAPGS